jgi:FkbM family methyltransferase
MALSAVFACCARSCAPSLPDLLRNLEIMAGAYDRTGFVLVENDSSDETAQVLRAWAQGRPDAQVISLEGLDQQAPHRTTRIAACRNAYMEAIRGSPALAKMDHLVVLDADEVNELSVDPQAFARARDWLEGAEDRAAAFCNSYPIYYDIYALRHPTWCPDDYQADMRRARGSLDKEEARRLYCYDRQIPLPRTGEPIEVESAFGGLGIYRLRHALGASYVGVGADGGQVCEHVAFNRAVGQKGRLFILPWLAFGRTTGLGVGLPEVRKLALEQGGKGCMLTAPADHRLDKYRASAPLYDRRLPVLSRLLSEAAPEAAAMDVGANIGDTIALCRLEGSRQRFIGIEASQTFFKFLELNRIKRPDVFTDTAAVWSYVGAGEGAALELSRGTARRAGEAAASIERAPVASLQQIAADHGLADGDIALVKLDTDGYDQSIILAELDWLKARAPVLWAEADIADPAHEQDWEKILTEGAEAWPWLIAFDNFGFAYCAGATREKAGSVLDLISYARRHKAVPARHFGAVTLYYPDIALFPARFAGVFKQFRKSLRELSA